MGPKQSLLPNSTETPSPTHGWEALPKTVPRGASSQGPGHRVMGRRDLSGDDRAWGKALGECEGTGVTQDTPESGTISESRKGHFRKDRLNMTLPEKEPCLTPFLSSSLTSGLSQATRVFRGLSWKFKTCCFMLRVNTSPSWAPTTHTAKPSPRGTDTPLWPLSQEGLRTVNSCRETNWDFPTLSLGSHSPPGKASCTQQQEAPPLTTQSPSGHTAGPDPSPLRTEHAFLGPDLSPQDWENSDSWCSVRDPDWNQLGHLKHSRAVDQHKLPEGESLDRGYKTWVCKCLMNETWSLDRAPFRGEKHPPTLFLSQSY